MVENFGAKENASYKLIVVIRQTFSSKNTSPSSSCMPLYHITPSFNDPGEKRLKLLTWLEKCKMSLYISAISKHKQNQKSDIYSHVLKRVQSHFANYWFFWNPTLPTNYIFTPLIYLDKQGVKLVLLTLLL